MDSADHETKRYATAEQIRAAIEALTVEELGRVRRAASAFLYGSEYTDPVELINEAIERTMRGAGEVTGRHWPLHVSFTAFLIMTMSSIADASANSPIQAATDSLADFVPEGLDYHDFAVEPLRAPSTESVCEDEEERAVAAGKAAATFATVEAHFSTDEEVLMMLLCLRDGHRPRQIQEEAGMTKTQYDTARRRLSRGLAKLGFRGPKP